MRIMRKLIVSIHSTANDVVTGPSDDPTNFMVWAQPGIEDSMESFANSLASVDAILLGRATYEDLVTKWPNVAEWPDVPETALRIGEKVNHTPKFVVTGRSTERLPWGKFDAATPITGPAIDEQISAMKAAGGGDIITFGSPTLVQSLANAGVVDEYRILVHPVIVNYGKRLFENLTARTDFRLVGVDPFPRGAMLMTYAPIRT
jgi:dihydrofolate reductase